MDSRIREALRTMIEYAESAVEHEKESLKHSRNQKYFMAMDAELREAREALALLTAEPEPCSEGEAIQLATKIGVLFLEYAKAREAICDPRDEVAKIISSYASQISDKRAEELRAHVEMLREAGLGILEDDDSGSLARLLRNWEIRAKKLREALAATEPKPSTKES